MRNKTKINGILNARFFQRFEQVAGNCKQSWSVHRPVCSCCDSSELIWYWLFYNHLKTGVFPICQQKPKICANCKDTSRPSQVHQPIPFVSIFILLYLQSKKKIFDENKLTYGKAKYLRLWRDNYEMLTPYTIISPCTIINFASVIQPIPSFRSILLLGTSEYL